MKKSLKFFGQNNKKFVTNILKKIIVNIICNSLKPVK